MTSGTTAGLGTALRAAIDTGLVVRGYISKIDGSVQPYGLVVPDTYTHKTLNNYRLDVWLHGRGDKLTELSFIDVNVAWLTSRLPSIDSEHENDSSGPPIPAQYRPDSAFTIVPGPTVSVTPAGTSTVNPELLEPNE